MLDRTQTFSIGNDQEQEIRKILLTVYDALKEKGYNPINQIVGYLMSGDPGYISSHKEARNKLTKFERSEILEVLVKKYLNR